MCVHALVQTSERLKIFRLSIPFCWLFYGFVNITHFDISQRFECLEHTPCDGGGCCFFLCVLLILCLRKRLENDRLSIRSQLVYHSQLIPMFRRSSAPFSKYFARKMSAFNLKVSQIFKNKFFFISSFVCG